MTEFTEPSLLEEFIWNYCSTEEDIAKVENLWLAGLKQMPDDGFPYDEAVADGFALLRHARDILKDKIDAMPD